MKRIDVTKAIHDALDLIVRTEQIYVPGRDSSALLELPKLALADAVLAAVRAPRAERLPARADRGVVYVRLEPIARKRRA